jgi:hypothetical protein
MEVIVLLVNFIAFLLALVWSVRADTQGNKATSMGWFAYIDFPEGPVKSLPPSRDLRGR